MLPSFAYARPHTVADALDHLEGDGARVHAGGTDLLGCLHDGVFAADKVVSLGALDELRGIRKTADGGLAIGALTTIGEVATDALVKDHSPGLAAAAATVASPQLRHQGTLGGNLCQRPRCWYFRGEFHCAKKGGAQCFAVDGENRYHAIFGGGPCHIVHPSDTAPALVALEASVRIHSRRGERELPLEEFFVLPETDLERENVLDAGELVTEVVVPPPRPGQASSYRKVRERAAWDFALVSVALAARLDGRRVEEIRVVLGGVAPQPWRCRGAEEALRGKTLSETSARLAAEAATQGAEPLEQNGYKVELVRGAVEASLMTL